MINLNSFTALAQAVTIETSADSLGAKFFGTGVLQVLIEDDSTNDSASDEIDVEINADGQITQETDTFTIDDTSDGSQRFEFFLVHQDSPFANGAGIDSIRAIPIMITFGDATADLTTGGPLFDDVSFNITYGGDSISINYEETLGGLTIDAATYDSNSLVHMFIEDQDANINPTDSDEFTVTDADLDDIAASLFNVSGAAFVDDVTFDETGDNSAIFEGIVHLNNNDSAATQELVYSNNSVTLTLNDKANYEDVDADDNNSTSTSQVSFNINIGGLMPELILNPIIDVAQGGSFTVSGNLTSGGVGLSGKEITFTDSVPGTDLSAVFTGGIEFVHNGTEGIKVEFCSDCPVDSERERTGPPAGNSLLLLKTGGIINVPSYTRGITLDLYENNTRHIEFEVTKSDDSTYNVNSTGMAPYVAVFTLIEPGGIKSLKIKKVVDNASDPADPDTPLRIGALQTFDLHGSPETQHYITFEPPSVTSGIKTSPWEVNPGFFFVTGFVPVGTPANLIPLGVIAHFAGDEQYDPDDSDPQTFLVLETSLGGGGGEGSSTSYSGAFYTTVGSCPTDTDQDAVCDEWETSGVADGIPYLDWDGTEVLYNLCHDDQFDDAWGMSGVNLCPKVGHKDVFVELDYMQGHIPNHGAIVDTIKAFGNTPAITNTQTDDFGHSQGITLHVTQDEQAVNHRDSLNAWRDPSSSIPFNSNSTDDFVSIKADRFGTPTERDAVHFSGTTHPGPTWPSDFLDTSCAGGTIQFRRFDINLDVAVVDPTHGFKGRVVMTATLAFDENPGTVTITSINRVSNWTPFNFDGSATGTVTTYPIDGLTRTIVVTIPFKTDRDITSAWTSRQLADVTVTLSCSVSTADLTSTTASPPLILGTALLDAKAQVYHYGMFIHSYQSACSASGLAETPGNDFIVSLGCGFGDVDSGHAGSEGTREEQAGTFMHELGHTLGLGHGGPLYIGGVLQSTSNYNDNCKPNYPSVMSYSRQFPIFFPDTTTWTEKGLDYSRQALVQLPESSGTKLDEPGGNGLMVSSTLYPSGQFVIHASPNFGNSPYWERVSVGSTPVDINWKMDLAPPYYIDQTEDINKFSTLSDPVPGCTGSYTVHNGFDDWSNLTYLFRGTSGAFDGLNPYNGPQEMTPTAYQNMKDIAAYQPAIGWFWIIIIIIIAIIVVIVLLYLRSRGII